MKKGGSTMKPNTTMKKATAMKPTKAKPASSYSTKLRTV